MSYRDDLKAYKEKREKIKKTAVFAAKITVVVLAAMFVLTTVMVVVDMVSGEQLTSSYDGDSGSGSGSKTPTITVPTADGKIYLYVGETVAWKSLVKVSEGCTVSVDNSSVNLDKTGVYEVKYTATNAIGKSTTLSVTVVVTSQNYSYSLMESTFKKKAESLGITDSMSKKDIVLKVYDYVNSPSKGADSANIEFTNESNIPDIDRDNWESDWIEEAIRTISTGEGDCYSYYSVSKAFFTVFGIDNRGIMRDPTSTESGTHFWLIVNIGDEKNEQWYYYDATRLAGKFGEDGNNNGCLMTLSKIQSYKTSKGGTEFYKFDPSKYPTASTTKVN